MTKKCYGCDKSLINEKLYHQVNLMFFTFMKDENTGQEEEVTNMFRDNTNWFCPECYDVVLKHFHNFSLEKAIDSYTANVCSMCGIDIHKEPYYHRVNLAFQTFVNNKEENKSKKTFGLVLCENHFNSLIKHVDEYIEEISKGENKNVSECETVDIKDDQGL